MKHAIHLLAYVALGACGAAESPGPTAAPRQAPLAVWDTPGAGRYAVRDVEVAIDGLPPGIRATLSSLQPVVVDEQGDARSPSGPTSRSDLRACVAASITFREGSSMITVPAGGEVRVLGVEGDQVRVAPPFRTWPSVGHVVTRAQIEGACTSTPAPPAGTHRVVPYRDALERACLFSRRPQEGTPAHVVLPPGASVEILGSRVGWVEARAVVNGATVTGWLHERTLVESDHRPDLAALQIEEGTTIGPFALEAGTPVLTGDPLCLEGPCGDRHEKDFRVVVETERGRFRLRGPASRLLLVPDPSGRAYVEVDEGAAACCYPDAPTLAAVRGVLSRAAIRQVISRELRAVRGCYERRLGSRPQLTGRLMTSFEIGPTGRVSHVRTSPFDPYVSECVRGAILNMRFPAPDGGLVGVNYPFVFLSGD